MEKDTIASIVACPVGCNSELLPSGLVVQGFPIRECSACGHLVGTLTEEEHLRFNKGWDRSDGTWPPFRDMQRLERRRLRTFAEACRIMKSDLRGLKLLDVGCSNGAVLDIATRHGMHAQGVEPAPNAALDGRRRGYIIHTGYVETASLPLDYFDIITMFEVIEHVPDPIPLLTACRKALRPGGILVIGTGNVDSWTFRVMREDWDFMHPSLGHINYYSTRSLAKLGRPLGFEVAKVITRYVTFFNRDAGRPLRYRLMKLASQAAAIPARIAGKGEQLEMYLQRQAG